MVYHMVYHMSNHVIHHMESNMKDYHKGRRVTFYLLPEQLALIDAQAGENRTARLVHALTKRQAPAQAQTSAPSVAPVVKPAPITTDRKAEPPTLGEVANWANACSQFEAAQIEKIFNDRAKILKWTDRGWML